MPLKLNNNSKKNESANKLLEAMQRNFGFKNNKIILLCCKKWSIEKTPRTKLGIFFFQKQLNNFTRVKNLRRLSCPPSSLKWKINYVKSKGVHGMVWFDSNIKIQLN